VPIVIWPKAVPLIRYDSRHLTTTLVDDMDSRAPTKIPCRVHQHSRQNITLSVLLLCLGE